MMYDVNDSDNFNQSFREVYLLICINLLIIMFQQATYIVQIFSFWYSFHFSVFHLCRCIDFLYFLLIR